MTKQAPTTAPQTLPELATDLLTRTLAEQDEDTGTALSRAVRCLFVCLDEEQTEQVPNALVDAFADRFGW